MAIFVNRNKTKPKKKNKKKINKKKQQKGRKIFTKNFYVFFCLKCGE